MRRAAIEYLAGDRTHREAGDLPAAQFALQAGAFEGIERVQVLQGVVEQQDLRADRIRLLKHA